MRARRLSTLVIGVLVIAACALPSAAGSGPSGGKQPVLRESAIFYYPWYSTPRRDGHWAHWYVHRASGEAVLSTPFYPARGLYSSSNAKVVDAHMREIASAGIHTVVVSWWGWGSAEDLRLQLVSDLARRYGLTVAIHLEPYRGRTPASAAGDMAGLRDKGYTDFYVYDADRDSPLLWAEALAGVEGVRVFGHTHLVGRAKLAGFDGLYTYDVATWDGDTFRRLCWQARKAGLLCAPSVGPGYDARLATTDTQVRPRARGARYDRMWRAAIRAEADVVTITSYNEWQEGTQIEPARLQVKRRGYDGAWGKRGMDAQRAYLTATARWIGKYRTALAQ